MEIIETPKYLRLLKLKSYLNYELSSSILFIMWFLNRLFIYLLILAVIIILPLILRVLYEGKKVGWMIFLFIIVLSPALFNFLPVKDAIARIIISALPFIGFYFYCFSLKWVIEDWIEDEKARNFRKMKQKTLDLI